MSAAVDDALRDLLQQGVPFAGFVGVEISDVADGASVVILDEPTAHLDVHHQFEFLEQVRGLVAAGRTVVAVFHDLELAARYASTLLLLKDGRIAASGAPRDVLTPERIASVFRMDADCLVAGDGTLRIHYRSSLRVAG